MVSFACSRIGLTIFLFVRESADRFILCGSVGLSLELFIVYQLERRLQMARPPHLMWRICHIFICVLQKSKKIPHSLIRPCGYPAICCDWRNFIMFRIVICPSFVNLANSTPISSEISTVFLSPPEGHLYWPPERLQTSLRLWSPSPFVPFSYLEMSARSISTASLSCFWWPAFFQSVLSYILTQDVLLAMNINHAYTSFPTLTDFSDSFMTCVLMNSGYQIAHSYSRTLAVPESLTE